jgi:hypothetical protein
MFKMNYTNKVEKQQPFKKEPILITFSTCWYIVKSKFSIEQYLEWIHNLFSIVNNFNLVIYTDINGYNSLKPLILTNKFCKPFRIEDTKSNGSNPFISTPERGGLNEKWYKNQDKIRFIIKPMEDFYGYRYKDAWIKNHNTSHLSLHKKIDWRLNMLWCEKIHFVNETIRNKYFTTMYYGWCDIGYFRNLTAAKMSLLSDWPSPTKILKSPNKIHYGCVQTNPGKYNGLQNDITTHYTRHYNNLKKTAPISSEKIEDVCFSGGFFILTKPLAEIYGRLFDIKLQYYFQNGFTIKDDQQIIMDCIFTNPQLFHIHFSSDWFMFQNILL